MEIRGVLPGAGTRGAKGRIAEDQREAEEDRGCEGGRRERNTEARSGDTEDAEEMGYPECSDCGVIGGGVCGLGSRAARRRAMGEDARSGRAGGTANPVGDSSAASGGVSSSHGGGGWDAALISRVRRIVAATRRSSRTRNAAEDGASHASMALGRFWRMARAASLAWASWALKAATGSVGGVAAIMMRS